MAGVMISYFLKSYTAQMPVFLYFNVVKYQNMNLPVILASSQRWWWFNQQVSCLQCDPIVVACQAICPWDSEILEWFCHQVLKVAIKQVAWWVSKLHFRVVESAGKFLPASSHNNLSFLPLLSGLEIPDP